MEAVGLVLLEKGAKHSISKVGTLNLSFNQPTISRPYP